MNWSSLQHFPSLAITKDAERATMFVIRGCQVVCLEIDSTTGECKELQAWYFDQPMPEPPKTWMTQFWNRLRAAPGEILEADQWASSHRTRMDGMVYLWDENRKECSDYLVSVQLDKD